MLSGRGNAVIQSGGGGASDVITLSGEAILAFAFGSNANAELFINDDGTVDRRVNFGTLLQIDAVTDWIIPNGSSPGLYQTRHTNLTGDALTFSAAAEDTWRAMTLGNYSYRNEDSNPLTPDQDTTIDVQIRLSTGSVLDTGSYRLLADREDF